MVKLQKKLESMDAVGRRQIADVISRSFDVASRIEEEHFWGANRTGVGFSKIVETGGRVQTTAERSRVRKFLPSFSSVNNKDLVGGDLHMLAEACVKLLGASRQSLGVSVTDKVEIETNAAVSGDEGGEDEEEESDHEDERISIPSDGGDFSVREASIVGAAGAVKIMKRTVHFDEIEVVVSEEPFKSVVCRLVSFAVPIGMLLLPMTLVIVT